MLNLSPLKNIIRVLLYSAFLDSFEKAYEPSSALELPLDWEVDETHDIHDNESDNDSIDQSDEDNDSDDMDLEDSDDESKDDSESGGDGGGISDDGGYQ